MWTFRLFPLVLLARVQSQFVPVLLWGTTPLSDQKDSVPALSFLNRSEFLSRLVEKTRASKPLVVFFVEHELSVEDFSLKTKTREAVFGCIERLSKEADNVEFMPSVNNPVGVIEDLKTSHGYSHVVYNNVEGTYENPTVVEVNLADFLKPDDRRSLLRIHDESVSQIYKHLKSRKPEIIAVFTGRRNPWGNHGTSNNRPKSKYAVMYTKDQMVIKTISHPFLVQNGTRIKIGAPIAHDSDYGLGYSLLSVKFNALDGKTLVLTFMFYKKKHEWKLGQVRVVDTQARVWELEPVLGQQWFPLGSPMEVKGESIFQHDGVKLIFNGLYADIGEKEDDLLKRKPIGDKDETVFFTATIWMGIIVVSVLGLILTWAITMLMDIKSVDRFDDPKNKPLIVSAVE